MTNSKPAVALSSGPFHIPRFNSFPNNFNNRLVISLKNPTDCELEAVVCLGVCVNPTTPIPGDGSFPLDPNEFIIGNTGEIEQDRNIVRVPPHSCKRIERFIDSTELRATFRVLARGDFDAYMGKPVGGLLEISVLAGLAVANPSNFGLRQADASTSIHYENWVVVC